MQIITIWYFHPTSELDHWGRFQRVVIEGHSSDLCRVLSGVPQGIVLALLLFICYVNDTTTSVKSKIRLYADDILLYRPIFTQEDAEILQEDIMLL